LILISLLSGFFCLDRAIPGKFIQLKQTYSAFKAFIVSERKIPAPNNSIKILIPGRLPARSLLSRKIGGIPSCFQQIPVLRVAMFTQATEIKALSPQDFPNPGQAISTDLHLSFNTTAADTIGD
jgi:hypothetical protein